VGAQATNWRIPVGAGEEVSAAFEPAVGTSASVLFVCAHGAGGSMDDRSTQAAATQLRSRGLHVVRFNFLYREKGSGAPDPMPRLKECYATVAAHARSAVAPDLLILGGRSMGGRVASMLAADSYLCDGLLLLAYPLHPAGQPDRLRDAHLGRIRVPVLCFNGTRDTLCRRDLMEAAIGRLSDRWTQHWLEGADHGFHVLKSSGRSEAEVLNEVGSASAAWVASLLAARGA
jgi:predicted alpha/beta-hydrolase family hydrolase